MHVIRQCRDDETSTILAIVNAAAEAYRDVIPADRWHDPYMSAPACVCETRNQRLGVGAALITHLRSLSTRHLLVGTWADATGDPFLSTRRLRASASVAHCSAAQIVLGHPRATDRNVRRARAFMSFTDFRFLCRTESSCFDLPAGARLQSTVHKEVWCRNSKNRSNRIQL